MTVAAAEAGTGAVEAEGAAASSSSRAATRRPSAAAVERERNAPIGPNNRYYELRERRTGGRTQQGAARRTGGRTQQGTGGNRRASTAKPRPAAPPPPRDRPSRSRGGSKRSRSGGFLSGEASRSNYHGIVLAEFVLAVLLVAGTPFARPNKQGVSPYVGADLLQIAALTVVYFLLAIVAGMGRGQARFSAWFGGLILLAVGLGEAATIAKAVTQFFGAPAAAPAATTTNLPNASVVNAGTEPAAGLTRDVAQQPRTTGASN